MVKTSFLRSLVLFVLLFLFLNMRDSLAKSIVVESKIIHSAILDRDVSIDIYLPTHVKHPGDMNLLVINDGQDLIKMPFENILNDLYYYEEIAPVLCVGIHCSKDRKHEYGMANFPDYLGRGSKAGLYTRFILEELIPFIKHSFHIPFFRSQAFAGFSLGGLMALDIVWNHSDIFSKVGVFSGSLWWRRKAYEDGYTDASDRLMHNQVRDSTSSPLLKFYFQAGTEDETSDRNGNGIIDSIDDTKDLIDLLYSKSYDKDSIQYAEIIGGKHDVDTWAKALPDFLKWGWGRK